MQIAVVTSVLLLVLASAAGGERPGASPALRAPSAARVQSEVRTSDSAAQQGRLTGTWEVRVQLESSRGLDAPKSRVVIGSIAIRPPQTLANGLPSERGVQSGTFDVDFGDLGFSLATTDALAWLVGSDSVRIKLHPAVAAGAVEMQGTFFDAKVIGGTWTWRSGARTARGSFVLRR